MKKPPKASKPKITVTPGKGGIGSGAAAPERNVQSPLMTLLGGKKDYKKQGSEAPGGGLGPADGPGSFGMTGLSGES